MCAGLALALGGGHFAIAAVAALPFITRLAHLAVPTLLSRHASASVAAAATWIERLGFTIAACAGFAYPGGGAIAWLVAGLAIAYLGQATYDASLASLHTESTTPGSYGRYTAVKARWAAVSGLAIGVGISVLVDAMERIGVPPHVARASSVAAGVLVHMLVAIPLRRMGRLALDGGDERGTASRHDTRGDDAAELCAATAPVACAPRDRWAVVRFALAWGFAQGLSTRQAEAMAIAHLGVPLGAVTMLNALLVGAGILGARTWGRLADRFGGKGLLSITLFVLALDPIWSIGALLVHPAFLVPSYLLWGVFNSGWAIAQSTTLVRTSGPPADRIRMLVLYTVAHGAAAGTAPLAGGFLLETLDARYSPAVAYGALFAVAVVLRVATLPLLRALPAPPAERGRHVSRVFLRAARRRAAARARALGRWSRAIPDAVVYALTEPRRRAVND
ncbi:MAG TPA: MFS transporter [Gemmatimonadaceae bacterium]